MNRFLGLITLLSVSTVHQAVGQACPQGFQYGIEDLTGSAVEGAEYQYCLVAKCGTAPQIIAVTVQRQDDGAVENDLFNIPLGFTTTSDPLCITLTAADNDCLDSGRIIDLDVQGTSQFLDPACASSSYQVFDDDVIEIEIKDTEAEVNVVEGTSQAEVCVHVTCVDGPTKRSAPILFYNEAVAGLAERQKKVVLIPEGTEDGDKVCCTFELNSGFDVADEQSVSISVSVASRDGNVLGDEDATIIVSDGVCVPMFVGNTPSVKGTDVTIDLPDCVVAAMCTITGTTQPCGMLFTLDGRVTRRTITVSVSDPPTPSFTRSISTDSARCDVHLINKGCVVEDNGDISCYFEATGPTDGNEPTMFTCSLTIGGMVVAGPKPCSPPHHTFTGPFDDGDFTLTIAHNTSDPNFAGCSGRNVFSRSFVFSP